MAITITKLKMWKDPGYTRNCAEIPPLSSKKLPTPDWTNTTDLRPRKNTTLSAIELPVSLCEIIDMSYLYMEFEDNAHHKCKIFGWIDSFEQTASSEEATLIRWSADWWRSYGSNAVLEAGRVIKCPSSTYKRPYRTHPRLMKMSNEHIIHGNPGHPKKESVWAYLVVVWNKMDTDPQKQLITEIRTLFCPVNNGFYHNNTDTTLYTGVNLEYMYGGYMDEWLASLSSTGTVAKVIGMWLAPVAPSVFKSPGDPYDSDYHNWKYNDPYGSGFSVHTHNGKTMMISDPSNPIICEYSRYFLPAETFMTDDMQTGIIIDMKGNVVATLPYGVPVCGYRLVLDVGPDGGNLHVSLIFNSTYIGSLYPASYASNEQAQAKFSKALGTGFSIPLPKVPITENQWSDYMITGQRDFDVESARIANEQRAIAGAESAVSSAIGGGVTGAVAGPAGAAAGIIGGGAVSGIMTGINYALGENFNHQLQEARERLYANQKNGILLLGDSYMRLKADDAFYIYLVSLAADSVSASEYTSDVTLNGYDTDITVSDTGTFIGSNTGPYRITNLTVRGNIPPQAKQYIKDKFETGVRIVEKNPTGVIP